MISKIKAAAAQFAPEFTNYKANMDKIIDITQEAAGNGANLIVMPECCLSGYVFQSRNEALPHAQTIPGPATAALTQICCEKGLYIILGLLEKSQHLMYNSAVFIGPHGIIGKYRKTHLPYLGVDRFTDKPEGPFEVFESKTGKIGMHICYDVIFPETARVLSLKGAEVLALPANFPSGRGERVSDMMVSTRAMENRVYIMLANRTGSEGGFNFAGLSKIVDPKGEVLAAAGADDEQIIYAELDLDAARQKHLAIIPGKYEVDYKNHRRPELYGEITKPASL